MRSYPNAAAGLNLVFWSEILVILGSWIPVIGDILSIVGLVLYLMGLDRAKQDDDGYGTAFALNIAVIVLAALSVITFLVPSLLILLAIAALIIELIVLYLVCRTTSMLAYSMGREDISRQGHTVWMINIICTIVSVVLVVLAILPGMLLMAGGLSVITNIASLVGAILYLVFLYKASQALA